MYDASRMDQAPGVEDMQAETRQILQQQQAFIHATDINIFEWPGGETPQSP